MNRNTPSYSLVRTLILGAATLAIVGVLFAIYQSATRAPQPAASPTVAAPGQPPAEPATPPGAPRAAEQGPGVELVPHVKADAGDKSNIRLYSPDSDRARLELAVSKWEPVGSGNQFSLTGPEIRMRTPNGQWVQITADAGLVELRKTADDSYDPQRGTLMGDVVIRVDRLDDKQRAALPEAERNNPGPDRLIVVKLEDVSFDLEYARLETAGPFSVVSHEAEFYGRGLALRYNEVDSSIDELRILREGRIRVRGMGPVLEVGLPGTAQGPARQRDDDSTDQDSAQPPELTAERATDTIVPPAAADQEAAPLTVPPGDAVAVLPLDEPRTPAPRPTIPYQAIFEGDVLVRQTEGGQETGRLEADLLELLFDFSQKQRETVRAQAAVPGEGVEPDEGTEETGQPAAPTELNVTWTGPLMLTSVRPAAESPDAPQGEPRERLHVTATGSEVRLSRSGQGRLRCRKLVVHQEEERAWLYGGEDAQVVIDSPDGGRLEGPEVFLDIRQGTARLQGPGRIADTRSGQVMGDADADFRVDIRFDDQVDITLAQTVTESIDPQTGQPVQRRRRHLEHAILRGGVSMHQQGDAIEGDQIEIDFDPPRREGSLADNIRRLRGDGSVRLVHGADAVRCDRIDVEMGLDESGRVSPRLARAYGHVSANQDQRSITAKDKMIATMRSFRVEREPWDIRKAQAEAVRRGVDPTGVDWEKQRVKYESEDRFRPGLLRLQAWDDVIVRDPRQELYVTAEALDCTFTEGRRIAQALVTGQEAAPAHVEMDYFSITGRQIDLDMETESAQVPGKGHLSFTTLRDLDGRELDQPMAVAVTWGERMTYRGAVNRAMFTGAVHAVSEESEFDCGELILDFAERQEPTPADSPSGAVLAEAGRDDWWILTPLVRRVWGDRGDDQSGPLGREFNKEPISLLATGGAVARTSKTQPGTGRLLSRGRIEGPRMLVNLRDEVLVIEDPGNLLIEDYELPSLERADQPEPRTPFGGLGAGSPSQTFITWQGQMTYYFGKQAAFFEGGVEMAHRSGTKIVLGSELYGDVAERLAQAGGDSGR
ncbi:MAG TPA: hypothetical protein VM243_17255, partial [Phycisphaerae bacterium]|nr:hypothetical protein [Phycisphaerae bacterium]